MEQNKQSASGLEFKLHPLVLINLSDHHMRVTANGGPAASALPVLGCLLGAQSGRTVDISNSFEIKYSVAGDGKVEIDHAFLLRKQEQYKQVFKQLDVVGWYATGSEVLETHMQIHKEITALNEAPVFLLLDPKIDHTRKDLPVSLYETELHVTDGQPSTQFVRANYSVETSDAERIGVDQVAKILPSGKASGSEQLSAQLMSMHSAIKMLVERLRLVQQILTKTQQGELPQSNALLRKISALVHSLPAMDTERFNKDYLMEFNDTLLTVYLAIMTQGVNTANDVVDKFMFAYDKSSRRRGLM